MNNIKKIDQIENTIFSIRGCKVMLDADLAEIYGVTTKRLNEQVKRNIGRFPEDFMFQLTQEEKMEVVANCDHLFFCCLFYTDFSCYDGNIWKTTKKKSPSSSRATSKK